DDPPQPKQEEPAPPPKTEEPAPQTPPADAPPPQPSTPSKKEEPKKDEPKKEDPKKDEPKKDAPKKCEGKDCPKDEKGRRGFDDDPSNDREEARKAAKKDAQLDPVAKRRAAINPGRTKDHGFESEKRKSVKSDRSDVILVTKDDRRNGRISAAPLPQPKIDPSTINPSRP
ncbi:MAG: hypothetical protein V4760_03370, partial [Bdellovibrionota bacterium]